MSDLEKYMVELRDQMDSEEPEHGHAERFGKKLKSNDQKIRRIPFRHAMQIAASVAIILASGFVIVKSSKGSSKVALNPRVEEFQEASNFYAIQVNERYESISSVDFNSDKEKEILLEELSKMDIYYKELQKELKASPGNEDVMNALIQHYQVKLKVMDQIIEQLIQIKNFNTEKNENETI